RSPAQSPLLSAVDVLELDLISSSSSAGHSAANGHPSSIHPLAARNLLGARLLACNPIHTQHSTPHRRTTSKWGTRNAAHGRLRTRIHLQRDLLGVDTPPRRGRLSTISPGSPSLPTDLASSPPRHLTDPAFASSPTPAYAEARPCRRQGPSKSAPPAKAKGQARAVVRLDVCRCL
ncbi:hypothetical protein C8R44DRAFT_992314, partial [Mycena epipterygia]